MQQNADTAAEMLTDEELVDRVLAGEKEQFATLVSRYNQRLYRLGWGYLHEHSSIEDMMQNAYVKAFFALPKFRRGSGFGTWLTRIMINECLMALRQRKSRREDQTEPAIFERSLVSTTSTGTQRITLDEMKALLEQAVSGLPASYRSIFLLREIEQLSTAEAAACLGISTVSAKVRLHRAKSLLKSKLLESTATAEIFAYQAPLCNALTARVMRQIDETLAEG